MKFFYSQSTPTPWLKLVFCPIKKSCQPKIVLKQVKWNQLIETKKNRIQGSEGNSVHSTC